MQGLKKSIDTLAKERDTFPSRLERARKTMIFNSAVATDRVSTEVAAVINVQFRGRSNSQLSDTPTKGNDVKTGRERREREETNRQRIIIITIIIEMHVCTFCLFKIYYTIMSTKRERPRPPKSVYMHVTSILTCIKFLSRFRSIKFFHDHGL